VRRLYPFLIALQFLTRIPVRLTPVADKYVIGRSLLYYPLVGVILGFTLVALNWTLEGAPALLRAALLLTAWVLLTGALHLDGLADSADAWVGGLGDCKRTLAIMKDPYCGPTAVVTVTLVLIIKLAALDGLGPNDWLPLVIIPMLARSAMPLLFLTTPYVRPGGIGSAFATALPRTSASIVVGASWLAALWIVGIKGIWLLFALSGTVLLLRAAMMRRLGGTTGDTAGALIEISETAMLLTAVLAKG